MGMNRNRIVDLLTLVAATIAFRASNNQVLTTAPLLSKYVFGFNGPEVGIVSSLISVASFVGSGLANSRLQGETRRTAFRVACLSYVLIFPFFYLSTPLSVWPLSAASGVIFGLIIPNMMTAASLDPDPRERERNVGIYTLALSSSLILGPAVEGELLKFMTLREVFLAFTPFAVACAALSNRIPFPRSVGPKRMRTSLRTNAFKLSFLNLAFYEVVFSTLTTFGAIYAVSLAKASFSTATALFSAFFASSLASRAYLSLRPPRRILGHVTASAFLTLLGVIALWSSRSNLLVYAASLAILGIPHGLTLPLSMIAIARGFPPENRGSANSQLFAFMVAVAVVTPPLVGIVADSAGFGVAFLSVLGTLIALTPFLVKYGKDLDNTRLS